jgi:hypothetical protein
MLYIKRFFLIFGFLLLLLILFGSWIEKVVNHHLAAIDQRWETEQLTVMDKVECKVLYGTMVLVGMTFYPEASSILGHYMEGYGKDLFLKPDYIKKSPVIIEALKQMKVGEEKEIRYKQEQDWRLSYALNPFKIRKEQDKIRIYQKIVFKKDKGIYTNFDLFFIKIKLPDRLIYITNPKQFTVYSEWHL